MTERKCANWLQSFKDWTLVRSEAPESFIFWTGLFTLASVIKRHAMVPKNLMGSYDIFANLFIIFVSPPGRARKTTTLNYSDELLEQVPNINISAQAMTQQVLQKRIADAPGCAISLRIGEFGTFINPSKDVMIDFLCSMYDGRKSFGSDTLIRNMEMAENPCVNLISATTPRWIANNLSETMIGGGFTSRTIFVYEERVRRRQLYYEALDYKALDKLRDDLIGDLVEIGGVSGMFELDEHAKDFMEDWYNQNADKNEHEDYRLQGYYDRKPTHIHKIAMLLHLAYSSELVIYKEDFVNAIRIIGAIEKTMPQVFSTVGKNPYTSETEAIVDWITLRGRVSRKEILSRFYHAFPSIEILLSILNALIAMESIKITGTGDYCSITYEGKSNSSSNSNPDPNETNSETDTEPK